MNAQDFYKEFRKRHPAPYFDFADITPLGNICFERLTAANFIHLPELFGHDENRFTDQNFRSFEAAKRYAEDREQVAQYLPKDAGQDWYFKTGGDYTGVLHLYGLSRETWNNNHKKCWIGFHTAPPFRLQGITFRVVQHFIRHIFMQFPQIDFIHAMIEKGNEASRNFLLKNGFRPDNEKKLPEAHDFFVLTRTGNAVYNFHDLGTH